MALIDPMVFTIGGFLISISAFALTEYRHRQAAAVNLEKRFNDLSVTLTTAINKNDKRLSEIEVKFSLFWNAVEQNFPKWLIQTSTPELDVYLRKANTDPTLNNFDTKELSQFVSLINEAIQEAEKEEKSGRLIGLGLYRARVVYELEKRT